MKPVLTLTFDEFCRSRGVHLPDEPGMHSPAAHVSLASRRRAMRHLQQRFSDYEKRRAELWQEYQTYEYRAPSRLERLQAAANGHPDLESTKAAKRLLTRVNQ